MWPFKLPPEEDRLCIYPIIHEDLDAFRVKATKSLWAASEIAFVNQDRIDFDKLPPQEQDFIKNILGFFAISDAIVMKNVNCNFTEDFPFFDIQAFYTVQSYIELVHAETYANLVKWYVTDENERNRLYKAASTIDVVGKKAEFAAKYMNKDRSLSERLLAFIIIEGLFFSGSFAAIFFFKKQNMLPALTTANEFISVDEGLHTEFGVHLYNNVLKDKVPQETAEEIFTEGLRLEIAFMNESLKNMTGILAPTSMMEYTTYICNILMVLTGHKEDCDDIKIPDAFSFMTLFSLDRKTNVFEYRSTEYQMPTESCGELKELDDF